MAIRKSAANTVTPQPFAMALGLLAGCVVVGIGGWVGLRPETILVRAVVVSCVTAAAVRIVSVTVHTLFDEKDE